MKIEGIRNMTNCATSSLFSMDSRYFPAGFANPFIMCCLWERHQSLFGEDLVWIRNVQYSDEYLARFEEVVWSRPDGTFYTDSPYLYE